MKGLKVLILVLAVFCSGIFFGQPVLKAANTAFSSVVRVEQGSNKDIYEVVVEVTNLGKDYTGTLRLVVSDSSNNKTGYDADISIPAGGVKEYRFEVPIYAVSVSEVTRVDIFRVEGKKDYSEQFKKVFTKFSNVLNVGILSDKPDNLTYLDFGGSFFNYNNVNYSIKINEMSGKLSSEEMGKMDFIVIDGFDTSTFPDETRFNIITWVNNGGKLILGTGADGDKVLGGLDKDLVDAYINTQFDSSISSNENNDSNEFVLSDVMYGNTYNYSSFSFMRSKNEGFGSVTITMFSFDDLGKEEDRFTFLQNVFEDAMNSANQDSNNDYYNKVNMGNVDNYLGYMEKPAKTASGAISFLIVIYIVFVGPIIYLILKSMKKREIIWYVIPAIAIAFVGIMFLVGITVRIKKATLKSVTIEHMSTGNKEAYLFGYSPKNESWGYTVKEGFITGGVIGDYSTSGSSELGSIKKTGNSLELTNLPKGAFELTGFKLIGKNASSGSIDFSSNSEDFSIPDFNIFSNGTLTNDTGYDLDYILIVMTDNNKYQLIEDIKNGDSVNINLDSSGSSYSYYGIQNKIIDPVYQKQKDYEKAAELSALFFTSEQVLQNSSVRVVGIRKTNSLTNMNEQAWTCYCLD